VRRGLLFVLAVVLLAVGVVLGLLARPLSGGTLLAGLLIVAGGRLAIELATPATTCTIDEACEILAAQRRAS
jgi:hypothetical protein